MAKTQWLCLAVHLPLTPTPTPHPCQGPAMLVVKVGFHVQLARVPMETLLRRILWKLLLGRSHHFPHRLCSLASRDGFLQQVLRGAAEGRVGGGKPPKGAEWAISEPLPWRGQWRLRVSKVAELFQMPQGSEQGGRARPRRRWWETPVRARAGQAEKHPLRPPPVVGPWGRVPTRGSSA